MAHIQPIEDESGDMVDLTIYCSDSCHREDPEYSGWYGCMEISVSEPCAACGDMVPGLDED